MSELIRQYARVYRLNRLALPALASLVAASTAIAQVPRNEVPVLSKPARATTNDTLATPGAAQTTGKATTSAPIYWYDGTRKQMLVVDPDEAADFGNNRLPDALPQIAPTQTIASKSTAGQHVSPLLRDAASGQLAGALPGGVLVRLKRPVDEQQAAAIANAFGSTIEHAIGTPEATGHSIWLFAAPTGLASLELANRIHESGQVQSASPNWWKPRALK